MSDEQRAGGGVTAFNITDEQIRELRAIAADESGAEWARIYTSTQIALGNSELRRVARARCAEVLESLRKAGRP